MRMVLYGVIFVLLVGGGGFVAGYLCRIVRYGPTIRSLDMMKATERAPYWMIAVLQSGGASYTPEAYGRARALTKTLMSMSDEQARDYFQRANEIDAETQRANIDANIESHRQWETLPWWRRIFTREPEWQLLGV